MYDFLFVRFAFAKEISFRLSGKSLCLVSGKDFFAFQELSSSEYPLKTGANLGIK